MPVKWYLIIYLLGLLALGGGLYYLLNYLFTGENLHLLKCFMLYCH